MNTNELGRLYRSIAVPDDSVEKVLGSITPLREPAGRQFILPRARIFALTAVALVVLLLGVLVLGLRSTGGHQSPAVHQPTASVSPPQVVLPPKAPNTVSGAVLNHGRPVVGAYVNVNLEPNSKIESHLKNGQIDPTKNLPAVKTNAHGSFIVTLSKADLTDSRYLEGSYINFEIDVTTRSMAIWNATFRIHHNAAIPIRMTFDFGDKTIVVNGVQSKLPVE